MVNRLKQHEKQIKQRFDSQVKSAARSRPISVLDVIFKLRPSSFVEPARAEQTALETR